MDLTIELTRQLEDPTLTPDEQACLRCHLSQKLAEAGNYESARQAMGDLWQRIGERPNIEGLDRRAAAEVLLRAGSLSGWIGRTHQLEGAQEIAKDLLSESITLFEELREPERVAEVFIDLSNCYMRASAFDEARVTLRQALDRLAGVESEQKLRALVNMAIVERTAGRFSDAFSILSNTAPLMDNGSHAIKGRFHNQFALALRHRGETEGRADYIDRALIEYTAASYHFEQAGHHRYCALVENNLGFLFLDRGRLKEAQEHLEYARKIFATLKDSVHMAQVDDTRARVLLAQRNPAEAERLSRMSARAMEKVGDPALLAESLTTHAAALARLGRYEQSREVFERAIDVATEINHQENAGTAALTMLEELGARLTTGERRAAYERADQLLGEAVSPEMLKRLRSCARRIFAGQSLSIENIQSPNFIYAADETASLLRLAHRVASVKSPLLISGETGTGKEELARLIHEWSGCAGEFIVVNCAALSDSSIESSLFGYRQGGRADFERPQPGAARKAAGGALMFDEITALSLSAQGKLVRFIEHGEIHPIGAPEPEYVNLRIMATTNRNLKQEMEQGRFRSDLFYRLEAFNLLIPSLRERPKDIPALVEHFLKKECAAHSKQVSFAPAAIEALSRLPLRGNARELRSIIEKAVLTAADGAVLTPDAVEVMALRQSPQATLSEPWANCSLEEEVLRYEGSLIKRALEAANGSVTRAARLLGVTHQGLAFILQGRQKNLLPSRTPARPRRRSLMRSVQRS